MEAPSLRWVPFLCLHISLVLLCNALMAASLMWLKNGEIILFKHSGAYISSAPQNLCTSSLTHRRTCSDAWEERSLTCILPPHLHSHWQTPEATESTGMALMWVVHTLILFLLPTDLQEWKKNPPNENLTSSQHQLKYLIIVQGHSVKIILLLDGAAVYLACLEVYHLELYHSPHFSYALLYK